MLDFNIFFVISICTELFFCFGRGIGRICSLINCFWKIWWPLKGPAGHRPALTGWLLRRLLLLLRRG